MPTNKPIQTPGSGIALIFLLAIAAFGLSLLNGFVWDDWVYMVPNPVYLEFDLRGMLLGTANSVEYLPVRDLSVALDAAIWGMDPFGFHLSNLAYYLASLFFLHRAVTRLARMLSSPRPGAVAFWTTLLFAAHPLHAEVVNFVGARNSILAGLFLFVSLDLLLKGIQENRVAPIGLSLVCYVLALFSKAIVVFFPVFLVALFLVLPAPVASLKRRVLVTAGFVVLTAAAVALHLYFAADSGVASDRMLRFGVESPWFQVRKALLIVWFYLRMTAVPWPMTVEYPEGLILQGNILFALITAALLATCVAAFWRWRIRRPMLALGLAWLFTALLPVLNFVPTHPVVADRYAYLAILGCAMLLAHWLGGTAKKRWAAPAAVALIAIYSVLGLVRTLDWKSDIALWRSASEAYPETGQIQLAQALWQEERFGEALEVLAIEKSRTGSYWHSLYAGKLAMHEGRPEDAIVHFRSALAEGGDAHSGVQLSLARAYEEIGDTWQALEHYLLVFRAANVDYFRGDRAAAQAARDRIWAGLAAETDSTRQDALANPGDFRRQAETAVYFYNLGQYAEAERFYLRALELQPDNWQAWHNLGLTYQKMEDWEQAIRSFKKCLDIEPGRTNSLNRLGSSYRSAGRNGEAIESFRRALEIDPGFFFAAFNLGQTYFSIGDRENALKYLQKARGMTTEGDPRRNRIDTFLAKMDLDF